MLWATFDERRRILIAHICFLAIRERQGVPARWGDLARGIPTPKPLTVRESHGPGTPLEPGPLAPCPFPKRCRGGGVSQALGRYMVATWPCHVMNTELASITTNTHPPNGTLDSNLLPLHASRNDSDIMHYCGTLSCKRLTHANNRTTLKSSDCNQSSDMESRRMWHANSVT